MTDAWETLGLSLLKVGRDREGIAALEKVIEIDPLRPEPHMALAKIYALDRQARQGDEARGDRGRARSRARAFEILAQIMMDEKRPEGGGGLRAAQPRRRPPADDEPLHPRHGGSRRKGSCEKALVSFRAAAVAKARQKGMLFRSLHFQTGDCLARLGRRPRPRRSSWPSSTTCPRRPRPAWPWPCSTVRRVGTSRPARRWRASWRPRRRRPPRPTGPSCGPSRCWATSRRLGPGPAQARARFPDRPPLPIDPPVRLHAIGVQTPDNPCTWINAVVHFIASSLTVTNKYFRV